MDIRQLQYLSALAREKHFTRAAAACNVTQSTLSGRIRQLEQELGVPIVARGQRFHGLTPEGERVLHWAHGILEQWDGMQKELAQFSSSKAELKGRLVLGVIPSALTMAPLLVTDMRKRHPGVGFSVMSHSSNEILEGIHNFTLDAGISYLDNEPVADVQTLPLYKERYCLFVRRDHRLAARTQVTWQEAAQEPLGLFTGNMQNRRIIDRAFKEARSAPVPELETNSVINLCSSIHVMGLASILPEHFLNVLGPMSDLVPIPLIEPAAEQSVGLLTLARDPPSPLVAALFSAAGKADLRLLGLSAP
jgi:DNA-binding transcriptional LysR family regulator